MSPVLSFIVAAVGVILGIIAGLAAYLSTRRTASGRVATSSAEVLWKQSQAMYEAVLKERDDARSQRDKLMSAQADQVIPILSAVLSAVQQLTNLIKDMDARADQTSAEVKQVSDILRRLNRRWGDKSAR